MHRVTDDQVRDVDVDVVWDVRRIDFDLDVAHHLLEDAAAKADAFGHAVQHERNADGDLLAGNQFLEVDMQHVPLERVALDLADQRARALAVDVQLDDGAAGGDAAEKLFQVAARYGERLDVARVPVNDGRHAALTAKGTSGTLAGCAACGSGKRGVSHDQTLQ